MLRMLVGGQAASSWPFVLVRSELTRAMSKSTHMAWPSKTPPGDACVPQQKIDTSWKACDRRALLDTKSG